MSTKRLVVIVGPTGCGKTALSIRLAEHYRAPIISTDSRQFYRGLPIGTAQPTCEERAAIAHHLVGIYELDQRAEVYTFVEMADRAIADIITRGKVPVLCGGTGLYLKSLLYGLDNLPGDDQLKAQLDAQYDDPEKLAELQARLVELGDEAVVQKFTNNRRRLIRALEIRLLTGRSIIDLQGEYKPTLRYNLINPIRLEHDRSVLQERIARRTRHQASANSIFNLLQWSHSFRIFA